MGSDHPCARGRTACGLGEMVYGFWLVEPINQPPLCDGFMTHYEAKTLGDFLRRIAIDYVRYGYCQYVLRKIPLGKDLAAIDQKLIETYGVTACRMKRLRLRRQGIAVVQYLRFGQAFVLLATEGQQEAFSKLRSYDIRESPLHFADYSVGLVGNTVTVRVARDVWRQIERRVIAIALGKKVLLENALTALPYYRFPGVVRQKWALVTSVNQQRQAAGLPLVQPLILPPRSRYRRMSSSVASVKS